MLTCTSPKSRNYTVGYRLGKGEKLDSIIETLGSVAEGVTTSQGLKPMTIKLGVYAPVRFSKLVCIAGTYRLNRSQMACTLFYMKAGMRKRWQ